MLINKRLFKVHQSDKEQESVAYNVVNDFHASNFRSLHHVFRKNTGIT